MGVLSGTRGRFLLGLLLAGLLVGPAPAEKTAGAPSQTVAEKIANSQDLLDINTATAARLKALPGMGTVYAQRVIAGRPYSAKNQLVQRGILPAEAYAKIKDSIIAHRVKK